ncbi:hypothetical protein GCM10028820_28410 [Tessaracoccus terricola]
MRNSLRLTASAVLLAGLLTGCADAVPADSPAPGTTAPTPAAELELEAAWLDDGRMVGVVTWGSSSCVPVAAEVTADGQTVTVLLDEGDPDQACTADLVPRATVVPLPEGVDPTSDVELVVTLAGASGDTDLDGNAALTGVPGDPTEYEPSGGWFDDSALVLLTWGSSSCPPIVESVEAEGNAGTVTFTEEPRKCTMDMAPRATVIDFGEFEADDDAPFTLTLVGDGLDATLEVLTD